MPSKEWETPFTKAAGNEDFPGETDGPGVYNNNPSCDKPTTGEFKMKFFETVPHGENLPLDSPLGTDGGKEAEKVSDLQPAHGAGSGHAPWDSPFTTKGGLLSGK
jgi:hypothetical protein